LVDIHAYSLNEEPCGAIRFEFPNNIGGVLNGVGESHGHVFHLCFGWQRNGFKFQSILFLGVLSGVEDFNGADSQWFIIISPIEINAIFEYSPWMPMVIYTIRWAS
jgi:hypothetical protein